MVFTVPGVDAPVLVDRLPVPVSTPEPRLPELVSNLAEVPRLPDADADAFQPCEAELGGVGSPPTVPDNPVPAVSVTSGVENPVGSPVPAPEPLVAVLPLAVELERPVAVPSVGENGVEAPDVVMLAGIDEEPVPRAPVGEIPVRVVLFHEPDIGRVGDKVPLDPVLIPAEAVPTPVVPFPDPVAESVGNEAPVAPALVPAEVMVLFQDPEAGSVGGEPPVSVVLDPADAVLRLIVVMFNGPDAESVGDEMPVGLVAPEAVPMPVLPFQKPDSDRVSDEKPVDPMLAVGEGPEGVKVVGTDVPEMLVPGLSVKFHDPELWVGDPPAGLDTVPVLLLFHESDSWLGCAEVPVTGDDPWKVEMEPVMPDPEGIPDEAALPVVLFQDLDAVVLSEPGPVCQGRPVPQGEPVGVAPDDNPLLPVSPPEERTIPDVLFHGAESPVPIVADGVDGVGNVVGGDITVPAPLPTGDVQLPVVLFHGPDAGGVPDGPEAVDVVWPQAPPSDSVIPFDAVPFIEETTGLPVPREELGVLGAGEPIPVPLRLPVKLPVGGVGAPELVLFHDPEGWRLDAADEPNELEGDRERLSVPGRPGVDVTVPFDAADP
ncbi:unnamed protein product, partial [Clonostachys byssicola]